MGDKIVTDEAILRLIDEIEYMDLMGIYLFLKKNPCVKIYPQDIPNMKKAIVSYISNHHPSKT